MRTLRELMADNNINMADVKICQSSENYVFTENDTEDVKNALKDQKYLYIHLPKEVTVSTEGISATTDFVTMSKPLVAKWKTTKDFVLADQSEVLCYTTEEGEPRIGLRRKASHKDADVSSFAGKLFQQDLDIQGVKPTPCISLGKLNRY